MLSETRTNDLVIVYDDHIIREAQSIGLNKTHSKLTNNSISQIAHYFWRAIQFSQITELQLNVMLVSGRGLIDVPTKNQRFLEDYIDMEFINITIGYGAIKHVIAASGKVDIVSSH
jgi:hypothetical protein